jgi:transcriptional regulator
MAEYDLDLLQGTLNILILRALTFGPMHGYAIARFIREGSAGTFRILDGALYTALHRMEELEWLASDWGSSDRGKRAKFYRLTPRGRRALRQETSDWNDYVAAFARVMRATPARGEE